VDLALAELCHAEARWLRSKGRGPAAPCAEGAAACGRVLAANPKRVLARALRGALGVLAGKEGAARRELEEALAADPHLRARFR
jgi:hypothetical protein